tara:strand:- start:1393 stop:1812 length:420 start_codon:yes stop_codon:yes gene_type:complete
MNSIICNNCYKIFLKKLNRLPNELKRLIFKFIPTIKLVTLNHYYYDKYHYMIGITIEQREYARYINDLIRNDNSLAFQQILKEMRNIYENEFTERKRYVYKRKIFKTLYDYLLFLCKNYESNNCKNLLINQQELKLKLT